MARAEVVYQSRRTGGGVVWVHRARGGWRTITFDSGPGQLSKLLGLASVLDRIGGATTTVVRGVLLVAQTVPSTEVGTPLVPRAGPVSPAVQPCGP
jgi:hypothetical protein